MVHRIMIEIQIYLFPTDSCGNLIADDGESVPEAYGPFTTETEAIWFMENHVLEHSEYEIRRTFWKHE